MNSINYQEKDIKIQKRMHKYHFWYIGRSRFIFHIAKKIIHKNKKPVTILDIGGGSGNWAKYLWEKLHHKIQEIAILEPFLTRSLADRYHLPRDIKIIKSDLFQIKNKYRWDVIFLLDVLEHVRDEKKAFKKISQILKKDGYLIMTVPALKFFWSQNDQYAGHFRRYSTQDCTNITKGTGLKIVNCRYFMFFLSLFLWITRKLIFKRKMTNKTLNNKVKIQYLKHNVLFNKVCTYVFNLETPIGHHINFPWGTSVLAVYKKI